MNPSGNDRAQAAISAYKKTSSATLSPKLQEREIVARVTHRLKLAQQKNDPVETARAISDNQVLWTVLMADLQNPANALPPALKASIVSVGMAVMREMDRMGKGTLDFDFLVTVNQNIMDGLEGKP
jgi:flagellar protein FlaF